MAGSRILIVEDHLDIGQLYRRLLRACSVTVFTDGQRACRALESESFDLVILDLHLGGMSGLDVLRFARRLPQHRSTPIVVISADDTLRSEARQIGIDGWITKPFDIEALEAVFLALL